MFAKAATLYDVTGKRFLYEKEADTRLPMASTTKIMTCIIALENCSYNEIVTISKYAASQPDVQLNAKAGERYYLKDLLYSLMLESHNDTAVAIAEHIGKKQLNCNSDSKNYVNAFAKVMNIKAKSLGCNNTNFVTPNGLDSEEHFTTAKELAIITSYAINNKNFMEITNTKNYAFSSIDKGTSHNVINKNSFLSRYNGAIGCKTGFTGKAGYCFVGAVEKNSVKLISVVLASGWPPHKTYKWQDTIKLFDYGYKYYRQTNVNEINPYLGKKLMLSLSDGIKNAIEVQYNMDNDIIMLNKNENIRYELNLKNKVYAPIHINQKVGNLNIYINDKIYKSYPVTSVEKCSKKDIKYFIKQVINIQFITM